MQLITIAICLITAASFEVASVKPDASATGVDRVKIGNGSVIIENVSLRRLSRDGV